MNALTRYTLISIDDNCRQFIYLHIQLLKKTKNATVMVTSFLNNDETLYLKRLIQNSVIK